MYHCKLTVNIFSQYSFLEAEMEKITPPERLEYEFHTYSAVSSDALQHCDIAFLDLPFKGNPEDAAPLNSLSAVRQLAGERTLLVLCPEPDQFAALSEADYAQIDEVIPKPYTSASVGFFFKKLINSIRLSKDYELSQTYLEATINSIPDLIWYKDVRGAHLKVNDAFCHAVGKTKQDIEGRGHYYIWDLKEEEYALGEYVCLETEEIVLRKQKTCLFDEKVKSQRGLRQFKTYKSPLFDQDGSVMGTVGIAQDVTDLENMGTELEIILRSMPFAILVKNNAGCIINVNEKCESYFKTLKGDLVGRDYDAWKSDTFKSTTALSREGYEEAYINTGSETRLLEIHEEPIYDVFYNLAGHLCIFRDITIERRLEQQILYNSNTDFLTGLYNRRYFYQYIAEHRGDSPIGLISTDLDYFKKVNDTYGHQAGDEALIATARLLQQCFPDSFISRLGGDEFLVMFLGDFNADFLREKAELLLQEMRQLFRSSKHMEIMSASIGIAQTSDPHMDIDALIRQSDIALYEAKRQGRSRYCFYTAELDSEQK